MRESRALSAASAQSSVPGSCDRSNTNLASHTIPCSAAHSLWHLVSYTFTWRCYPDSCLGGARISHCVLALSSSLCLSHYYYSLLPCASCRCLPGLTGTGWNSKSFSSFSCFTAGWILQKCHPNGHHPVFSVPR